MPAEGYPNMKSWKAKLSSVLAKLQGPIFLIGHSIGGSILLNYLSESNVRKPIVGLSLLAAPSWDADLWDFDDLKLPDDLAEKLAYIPRIFLYHSRDDEVVPFTHLAFHGLRLPQATIRQIDGRGHQFGNNLADIASDIRLTYDF